MTEAQKNIATVEAAYYAHLLQEAGKRIAEEANRAGGWAAFWDAKIAEGKARRLSRDR